MPAPLRDSLPRRIACLATISILLATALPAAEPERPNIVLILLDNVGQEWFGCYGSEERCTPNIDRLAQAGVRVENCYASPVCGPSRTMLLTGRYPHSTGFRLHHDAALYSGGGLDPQREIVFPRVFQGAGYVTGITGKWQINNLYDEPDALARHGFEEHLVWPGSINRDNVPPAEMERFADVVRRESYDEAVAFNRHIESRYWDPVFIRIGQRETLPGKFGPDESHAFAIDFLRRHRERPFLLYLPMVLTHGQSFTQNVVPTPANRDPNRPHHEMFADMLRYADARIGELIAELDRLALRDNTIVFVASDNGTEKTLKARRDGRLVQGDLYSLSEAGGNVVLLANCPRRIPGGRTIPLADFTDLYPTLCELGQVPLSDNHRPDGKSFAPYLLGLPGAIPPREWILNEYHETRVARDKRFKLYSDGRLYDANADPTEQRDLSASGDAAAAAARQRLGAVLASLPADTPPPFPLRSLSAFKIRGEARARQQRPTGNATIAREIAATSVYSVAEISFAGPRQSAKDAPSRDVELVARLRHESGAPEFKLQGYFDGDGRGGREGNVFKVRFCPTKAGRWQVVSVQSGAAELAGQHEGDYVTATESNLKGFWEIDPECPQRRWYRRASGSHQYLVGNTHYTFLTEHGAGGKPTGSSIARDIAGNARYFKKLRFGLQSGQYPHPTEKPWLDDAGQPTDDGNYSHRPNPGWFHERVDLAVKTAFDHDLIADLILAGPDTPQSRTTLKAAHNGGDATPYLRYIAARYGSFPNVWICLCNEYDIKSPNYTQAEIAKLGATIRQFLPYPTPLSVHDGSRIGWSAQFDSLPAWADHQIIQKKLRSIGPAADAIDSVARGADGRSPRNKPTINDELSYEGAGDKHSEQDTIEAHLGALLGGGYGTTGEKHGQKLGQYFWGNFDPAKHASADNLGWLHETIDREIAFWNMTPSVDIFENAHDGFRGLAWPGHEYLLGTNKAHHGIVAKLPTGSWTVAQHDIVEMSSSILSRDASSRFEFASPASRAVLFHFRRNTQQP